MKQQAARTAAETFQSKKRDKPAPRALLDDAPCPHSLSHFSSCQYPSERLAGFFVCFCIRGRQSAFCIFKKIASLRFLRVYILVVLGNALRLTVRKIYCGVLLQLRCFLFRYLLSTEWNCQTLTQCHPTFFLLSDVAQMLGRFWVR